MLAAARSKPALKSVVDQNSSYTIQTWLHQGPAAPYLHVDTHAGAADGLKHLKLARLDDVQLGGGASGVALRGGVGGGDKQDLRTGPNGLPSIATHHANCTCSCEYLLSQLMLQCNQLLILRSIE